MRPQAEASGDVIFDHLFAFGHRGQQCGGFNNAFAIDITLKEGQRFSGGERFCLPKRLATAQADGVKRVCLG